MKVYVIIVNYNECEKTKRAVESVLASKYLGEIFDVIIILIDNSESDKYLNCLKNYFGERPNIFFIKNSENLGFAKAVNIGLKMALNEGFDYVFLLNDDAYLDKNCLWGLIKVANENKDIGLVSPVVFYSDENGKIWSAGGYFDKLLSRLKVPLKNKYLKIEDLYNLPIQFVDFVSGCAMLIRTEVVKEVGLFDESFYFYNEDLDYCFRVKKRKFKIAFVPNSFAYHEINITKDRTNPFVMYHLAKTGVILRKKHFSKLYYFYYLLLHFLIFTPFRILQILLGSKDLNSIIAWFAGTIDGIKFSETK
ncbi:MAG: glycosyltransferase family 2 protein [Candidatus Kryptonium sp.]